jgi:hypothetical protein
MSSYEQAIATAAAKIERLLKSRRQIAVDPDGVRELAQQLDVRLHPLYCAIDGLCLRGAAVLDQNVLRLAG